MDQCSASGVGVVDKAARILAALEARPRSLGELAADTGLSRATAHRLASALLAHGLLRRDERSRFALGFWLVALGTAALRDAPLATIARPAMEALAAVTGESVQLYVRQGSTRACVAAIESTHSLRTIVRVGAVLPLDRGSAGAVLRDDPADRSQGWVQSVEERERGVASVSAPVRDERGHVVAAISVSGPVNRTGRSPGRRHGADVVDAARRIARDACQVPPHGDTLVPSTTLEGEHQ